MNIKNYAKACDNYTEAARQFKALTPQTHPKVARRIAGEYWKYTTKVQLMEEELTGQKVKGK